MEKIVNVNEVNPNTFEINQRFHTLLMEIMNEKQPRSEIVSGVSMFFATFLFGFSVHYEQCGQSRKAIQEMVFSNITNIIETLTAVESSIMKKEKIHESKS